MGHSTVLSSLSISSSKKPRADAIRFLRRLAIFSLPLVVFLVAMASIDPFELLGLPSWIRSDVKFRTAGALNPCLWKLAHYRRHPVANVIFGDSRMAGLRAARVQEVAGEEYANLAFGGGSMREMIDAFWFASRLARLKKVYLGLNLNVFNDYNNGDRTAAFLTMDSNPAVYFVNRTVVHAAMLAVYSQLRGVDLKLGVPAMSREAFWKDQLFRLTDAYYSNYVYPRFYLQELRKIADYCRANGISMQFVIPPTHVELQQRISEFHLDEANRRFRRDLAVLAPVIDFDFPTELTRNRSNFSDPYHLHGEHLDAVIHDVWGGTRIYSREFTRDSLALSAVP